MADLNRLQNIIFDIDGTIADNGEPITIDVSLAIESVLAKNINVIFATGRPLRDALPLLPHQLHGCFIIGCNGGMIAKQAKVQSAKTIAPEIVDIIKLQLDYLQLPYIIEGLQNYATSPVICEFHHYIKNKLGNNPKLYTEIRLEGITKILLLQWDKHIEAQLQAIFNEHQRELTINVYHQYGYMDIMPANTNKYYAAVEMGIDFSKTAVFGNDLNDLLLLRNSQRPYVVGTHLTPHIDFTHTKIAAVSYVPAEILKLMDFV